MTKQDLTTSMMAVRRLAIAHAQSHLQQQQQQQATYIPRAVEMGFKTLGFKFF